MGHHMHTQDERRVVSLVAIERANINLHADLIRAGSHGRPSFTSQNLDLT